VNRSLLKFITDYGPLLIFFTIYYKGGKNLTLAIPPFIIATLLALILAYFIEKKIAFIPLMGGILITFFGGLTIYFNNPIFLYMKPTIINLLFGFALIFGKFFSKEPLLKKFLGNSIKLENEGWEKLSIRWILFFFFLAILNECVWRTQTEEFWVNFKVWGLLPFTFIFTAFQIKLINKYKIT
jgi:intracellular septation protein|tara:strand:+ start:621 stop:1169 length:549 start_codon:yes stop_codon:yes gene_type:complete